ncbi:hypothetical protein BJX64DRAFT_297583 [Aspergillus heterothallicus]
MWREGIFCVCVWSFNIAATVACSDGSTLIFRFPLFARMIMRREKVFSEAATMRFILQHTQVPVPEFLGLYASPMGPVIAMSKLPGTPILSYLHKCGNGTEEPERREVRQLYAVMAEVALRLSLLEFDYIGALMQFPQGIRVATRPYTFSMNELVRNCGLLPDAFTYNRYTSSRSYFEHLANEHIEHIRTKVNFIVDDDYDCRRKITARFLFLNLVKDKLQLENDNGPFRLYCDDFRPANVLVTRASFTTPPKLSGVIDWEFAYAAPAEFTSVAPWWLLAQNPSEWSVCLAGMMLDFEPRLEIFLEAMRECEDKLIHEQVMTEAQRLSHRMKASMKNGLFWVCLAALNPNLFDAIYWDFLDEEFYGRYTCIEDRIGLLSREQQNEVSTLTRRKMEELSAEYTGGIPPNTLSYADLCNL